MSQKSVLWAKSYPDDVPLDFKAVPRPVYTLLEKAADGAPKNPCLTFMGQTYNYDEVLGLVNRTAKGLQELGLKKGDRVGLCLPNCPYFVIAYYAALKVGAVVVNFNPLYTAEEIEHQAKDSGIKVMFTLDVKELFNKVAPLREKSALKHVIICPLGDALPPLKRFLLRIFKRRTMLHKHVYRDHTLFGELTQHGPRPQPVRINPDKDLALIQYTGGTTGLPKGAMLTHTNVSTNTAQAELWLNGATPQPRVFLAVLPFFHVFSMTAVMNLGISTASHLILMPRFDLKALLKNIVRYQVSFFAGVPTIYNAINTSKHRAKYDLTCIDYCISGGAPMPAAVREAFIEHTGCMLVEGYGLSECSPVAACNPRHTGGRVGSIGLPFPGTILQIRDLENRSRCVEQGECGEIYVQGPQVMAGYWKNETATQETLHNGWLATGDVGYMDEDGYTFITDRLKEIIISNGYNIYPRTIEEAIYTHPDVDEVIVIGIPHPAKGEVPKAFVKRVKGATLSEDDLMAFIHDKLNPLEQPSSIEFRDELPKTLIGKLSKKELIAEEKEKQTAASNATAP